MQKNEWNIDKWDSKDKILEPSNSNTINYKSK